MGRRKEGHGLMSTTTPSTPARPWLIYADGELYGDYRTEADQLKALPGAIAAGEDITISRWDHYGYRGPGWTEPEPVSRSHLGGAR
jgi:hypothetical protein